MASIIIDGIGILARARKERNASSDVCRLVVTPHYRPLLEKLIYFSFSGETKILSPEKEKLN
jgi:hypothetical protein